MTHPDELLTPKELASKLKVSERTVRREQAEGHLPGRLVRGKLRFSWPEVLRAVPAAPAAAGTHVIDRIARQTMDLTAILKSRVKHWERAS